MTQKKIHLQTIRKNISRQSSKTILICRASGLKPLSYLGDTRKDEIDTKAKVHLICTPRNSRDLKGVVWFTKRKVNQMGNKRKRYSEEQIASILKEAEVSGNVADTLRKYGVNDTSYYRWKSKYGGMESKDVLRLKELERENARLKRIVADQLLDITMLKDINSKNC